MLGADLMSCAIGKQLCIYLLHSLNCTLQLVNKSAMFQEQDTPVPDVLLGQGCIYVCTSAEKHPAWLLYQVQLCLAD